MLDPGPGRSVASAAVAADPLLPHVSRADALVEEAVTVGSRGDVRAAWRLLEVKSWRRGLWAIAPRGPCCGCPKALARPAARPHGGSRTHAQSALEHCPQHPSALGNLGYLNAIMGDRVLARQQVAHRDALLSAGYALSPTA